MRRLPGAEPVSDFMVERELACYDIADHIIVPSTHVAESFAPWPEHAHKLFLNPLGVYTQQFPLCDPARRPNQPTALFVGQWSYRKGVDILAQAIEAIPDAQLVHVGMLSDAPFPRGDRFTHCAHAPQQTLKHYYASAHLCVLPSREDGFGVVLSQALSCGLPVVCTDKTGGPDLAKLPGLSRLVHVVPAEDPQALRGALIEAFGDAMGKNPFTPITDAEREMLDWSHYATRDLRFMLDELSERRKRPIRIEQVQRSAS